MTSTILGAVLVATMSPPAASPEPSDPIGGDWQSSVTRALANGEYHLSLSGGSDGFTAPNRAHDFRSRWSSDGAFTLESRTDAKSWSFSYRLLRVGRGATTKAVPEVRRENVSDGRIEWQRDGIREWYVNDARGIEQGFQLESRPGGDARDPVIIAGAIDGLLAFPAADDQSVLFRTPDGRDAMRMRDLSVKDAAGNAVPACLEAGVGSLALVVDDEGAVYPLTVAPLVTGTAWNAEGNQDWSGFGYAVATAGDVNGDGFTDVIVGAHLYDNGEDGEGRAFVYLGSAAGLLTTAAWSGEGDQISAHFGYAVATAGDVNGDGYADVIVAAHEYDNGETDEGRVFVYLGSASGLAATAAWTAESDQSDAAFGYSVATAGDINNDGYTDVIVGAPYYDNGESQEGGAFLYLGSGAGLAASAAWTGESDQMNAWFSTSVATAGDVNGDGYADVVVGARYFDNGEAQEGRAFLYLGSAAGLATAAAWTAESDQPGAEVGTAATAGDVNGDGYADVIVGAWHFTNGELEEGRASLYLGSTSGLATAPSWTVESNQANAWLGLSVATAGDVNGDGYADIVIGTHRYANGESQEGRAQIFLGSIAGLATAPSWTAESDQAGANYGIAVATAGDVNGDGFSDVIAGAIYYANGEIGEGAAFVYHGSAAGLAAAESWSAESNQLEAHFGGPVATAGDVNGDGYSDVIADARWYDNGEVDEGRVFVYHGSPSGLAATPEWTAEGDRNNAQLGTALASAGDVNGDGFSDVIVGAYLYSNGQNLEGRALVYHGSAAGLATVPAWTAESNQASAHLGYSVASAGDVNGDGFSDVIAGAIWYDNGESNEGRVFLYHGSVTGLQAVPAWTFDGEQVDARFGESVATAGDVNGDGFSDVIIGANAYSNGETNEGRVLLFMGSAGGLTTVPTTTIEGNQADALFGTSVVTAGDVNGDGFSDVIVGAVHYDNGDIDEGRAFGYYGSPSGLQTSPAWTTEGNQSRSFFAYSVATAGDVNGDGYSDVVVGAYGHSNGERTEGRAYLYHGSSSGLPTTAAWIVEANQEFASLGLSVATAGDVNGDGYSDLLVGAPYYGNIESDEGRVFLYYGNDGDGLDRNPRQARADGAAPIDLLGGTLSTDGFRLRANGRSPFGRDQVRLEWEVKPVATPFDGADIRVSNWFDTGAPGASGSVVPLDELHTPLLGPGPFHWRLRLRSRSPFPWQSHWMSLPYNAITETDLRTENNVARCDLAYADLTFPPLTPAKVAPWVYTLSCAAGDVLPTLLLPSIVSGTDVDTLGGGPGTLRFYQLSCGCAEGMWLTKRAGSVRLDMF